MDEITPACLHLHHVPCRNKKGGGVAVFARNDIDRVLSQTDQWDTFEHITIKLSERQSSHLLVHVINRPPSTSKSQFIEEFNCFLEVEMKTSSSDSQNCWTGNFNTVLDFDFIQHVSTPMSLMYSALVNT